MIRARFAATELGIREKLVVLVLGQSSLTVVLNATIGPHVPHLYTFVDASRIDADIAVLPNLVPYKPNGLHTHVAILDAVSNMVSTWKFRLTYQIHQYAFVIVEEQLTTTVKKMQSRPYDQFQAEKRTDWSIL